MKKPIKKTQTKKAVKKPAKKPVRGGASTTRWIVTAVDSSDTCDGKARVLGAFKSEQAAKDYVRADMDGWIKSNVKDKDDKEDLTVDYDRMSAEIVCGDGREWNVESVEIDL